MGLFSFLKKKKAVSVPTPPSALPVPKLTPAAQLNIPSQVPSAPKKEPEMNAPRQVDDFGIPFDEFELPEIQIPKFNFPTSEERDEIQEAIKKVEIVKAEIEEKKPSPKREEIPHEIPELKKPVKSREEIFAEEVEEIGALPKKKGAIFMSVSDFTEFKENLNSMKDNLKKASDINLALTELKSKQDADFKVWHGLNDIAQKKLFNIDRLLFEKQRR